LPFDLPRNNGYCISRLSLCGSIPFELDNLVNLRTLAVGEGALAFCARARNEPAIPDGPTVLYYG